jgi:ribosomal protein S18 acetylase RimI-like enzyme
VLDVNLNNPGAARVYERLGFHRIGRRARYGR